MVVGLHVYVHAHEAFGESRNGELRRRYRGHGTLATLDAVDDDGRVLSGLVGGEVAGSPSVTRFGPEGPLDCTT